MSTRAFTGAESPNEEATAAPPRESRSIDRARTNDPARPHDLEGRAPDEDERRAQAWTAVACARCLLPRKGREETFRPNAEAVVTREKKGFSR